MRPVKLRAHPIESHPAEPSLGDNHGVAIVVRRPSIRLTVAFRMTKSFLSLFLTNSLVLATLCSLRLFFDMLDSLSGKVDISADQ